MWWLLPSLIADHESQLLKSRLLYKHWIISLQWHWHILILLAMLFLDIQSLVYLVHSILPPSLQHSFAYVVTYSSTFGYRKVQMIWNTSCLHLCSSIFYLKDASNRSWKTVESFSDKCHIPEVSNLQTFDF